MVAALYIQDQCTPENEAASSVLIVAMADFSTDYTASEQARLRRIGELLARAISRKCHEEELEKAKKANPTLPEDADPILIFISEVGECSPKEVRERFSLSRTTAFRRLSRLVDAGQLAKSGGSTNAIRYRLAA